ncbi:lipopolysaccharide biosynthesis protein [Staphylococcus gallinarum]|uniref:Lipopolysaccharide biosynthesis protein n=1 Tax=Staphylococcus gallinarum TaxID=1293 RepID=A0A380FE63_STAGA|nr:lipopolysaccharide biosynthesis protein [Staphylococcus gallinarum]
MQNLQSFYDELIKRNISIYNSIERFYENNTADLSIISTPIHLHKYHACLCMNNNSHVLCEKPVTANYDDIHEMERIRDKTGKFLAIGFNWSFINSILELKKDIIDKKFGKPIRVKSMVQWPRNEIYYNRSSWAGKKFSSDNSMIFDSVANNATAHFLHNLFYLNGDHINTSVSLNTIEYELYRVNNIETFDTCALHIKSKKNIDIFFYASHATKNVRNPCFELEFEKATIKYDPDKGYENITAFFKDGLQKTYMNPEAKSHLTKLYVCIDAILTNNYRIPCGLEAATPHVLCIKTLHGSFSKINLFPKSLIRYSEQQKQYWVNNLDKDLEYCYSHWILPNDADIKWSKKNNKVNDVFFLKQLNLTKEDEEIWEMLQENLIIKTN